MELNITKQLAIGSITPQEFKIVTLLANLHLDAYLPEVNYKYVPYIADFSTNKVSRGVLLQVTTQNLPPRTWSFTSQTGTGVGRLRFKSNIFR